MICKGKVQVFGRRIGDLGDFGTVCVQGDARGNQVLIGGMGRLNMPARRNVQARVRGEAVVVRRRDCDRGRDEIIPRARCNGMDGRGHHRAVDKVQERTGLFSARGAKHCVRARARWA